MNAVLFGVFAVLAALGVPIAIALGLSASASMHYFTNTDLMAIVQRFFTAVDSYSLMAIPLFIISGALLNKGGVSKRLVDFANSIAGWLPGGLAIVTFVASAFFGAISGSSVATVAAIGGILIPAMIKEGYPIGFTLATAASAGWLGIIVPPSIPMIICGTAGGVSVGDLFLGGFIPGFILAGVMGIYAIYYGKKHLSHLRYPFSFKQIWKTFKKAIWALGMPIIILGGIYSGIFTPTEAAAVSIFYGLIVGFLVYKELTIRATYKVMENAAITTATIMIVVAMATAFAYLMTTEQVPQKVALWITSVAKTRAMFLFMVTVMFLIVGTFMDTVPAILILTPIFMPMLNTYGINPVAFGLIMIINLGIGLITPPVGLNLYVAAGISKVPATVVINKHLLVYFLLALACLILFMSLPGIIMLLPNLLG